jgi:hypothetical protein
LITESWDSFCKLYLCYYSDALPYNWNKPKICLWNWVQGKALTHWVYDNRPNGSNAKGGPSLVIPFFVSWFLKELPVIWQKFAVFQGPFSEFASIVILLSCMDWFSDKLFLTSMSEIPALLTNYLQNLNCKWHIPIFYGMT